MVTAIWTQPMRGVWQIAENQFDEWFEDLPLFGQQRLQLLNLIIMFIWLGDLMMQLVLIVLTKTKKKWSTIVNPLDTVAKALVQNVPNATHVSVPAEDGSQ
jgi:hypothetical protein